VYISEPHYVASRSRHTVSKESSIHLHNRRLKDLLRKRTRIQFKTDMHVLWYDNYIPQHMVHVYSDSKLV
jgi:hypothetical protein